MFLVIDQTSQAREKLFSDPTWHHDYLPFLGNSEFLIAGEELFFGSRSRVVTSQLCVLPNSKKQK
jgi:hypothetical protein